MILWVIAAVVWTVIGTTKLRLHPFLVLVLAAYGLGLGLGLPPVETAETVARGLGSTLGSIGIVIAAGTLLGTLLEASGAMEHLARRALASVGPKVATPAMGILGGVVSISVFCDSGFVILVSLCRSLAAESGVSVAVLSTTLSMGLYSTHVLVPPTPGPVTAAAAIGADMGSLVGLGLVLSLVVIFATAVYARLVGRFDRERNFKGSSMGADVTPVSSAARTHDNPPAVWLTVLLLALPLLLMGFGSFAELDAAPFGRGLLMQTIAGVGRPGVALLVTALFTLFLFRHPLKRSVGQKAKALSSKAMRDAGQILLITGAGGALGTVLQASPLGDQLTQTLTEQSHDAVGLVAIFIVTAALKTFLGSSTVAIVTAAAAIAPLLPQLGLSYGFGPELATLSIGAGAMVVSHVNDSYFWVVGKFSEMTMAETLRYHSGASLVGGLAAMSTIMLMALVLLH